MAYHERKLAKLLYGWSNDLVNYEPAAWSIILTWKSKRRYLECNYRVDDFLKEMGYTRVIHRTRKRGVIAESQVNYYGTLIIDQDLWAV